MTKFTDEELESVPIHFEVRDWTVLSGLSVKPGAALKPKGFDFFSPSPPRTELRLKLVPDLRSIYIRNGDDLTKFEGEFNLRVVGSEKGINEGAVRHAKAGEGYKEYLDGGIAIPKDQFDWLLSELEKPHAYLSIRLEVPMFENGGLPYDTDVTFFGFTLNVLHGPGLVPNPSEPVSVAPEPVPAPAPRDERLTYIIMLLFVLIAAVGYYGSRSSP